MTDAEKPVGRDSDKFMLRFPEGMRDQISAAAKESGRSMNAEIVHRLGKTFAPARVDLDEGDIMALMYSLAAAAAKKGLVLDIRVSHKPESES